MRAENENKLEGTIGVQNLYAIELSETVPGIRGYVFMTHRFEESLRRMAEDETCWEKV